MKLNFFGLLLLASSYLFISCSADPVAETTTPEGNHNQQPVQTNVPYAYDTDETRLAVLINNHRAALGMENLVLVNFISATSEDHNAYMIANEVVNHDGFSSRLSLLTEALGAQGISENVAYNYQSAEGAFNAWLGSPGHRAAIEGNSSHFGLSVSSDEQGRKYYTAIFATIN